MASPCHDHNGAEPCDPQSCLLEYEHMRAVLGSDAEVWKVLQHQFGVIHQRLQAIFTLGGLGITVTGFSGHRIVAAGIWSGAPLVVGLVFILAALFTALYGAAKLRWVSSFYAEEVPANFCRIIALRNSKSRIFRIALAILVFGLSWYVVGISNFLVQASFRKIPIY